MKKLICWMALAALLITGTTVAQADLPKPGDGNEHPIDILGRIVGRLHEEISPSVVAIKVTRDITDPNDPDRRRAVRNRTLEDFYNRPDGWTSGTIISEDGWILTSWFNVRGSVTTVEVSLPNGDVVEAEVVGRDELGDVALLKVEAEGLKPIVIRSDLSGLKQGHFTCALGRSPDPNRPTINLGIVSALGRFKGSCMQTDAELNYGNCGGPLVDLEGRLIGIASHINTRGAWGQSSGVGFATRADRIASLLDRMKKGETIEKPADPWIGFMPAPGAMGVQGVLVEEVTEESPAEAAGLKKGDVIQKFEGKPVANLRELQQELQRMNVGDEVTLTVMRGDAEQTLTVKLEERP